MDSSYTLVGSLSIPLSNKVYVADPINRRIQVIDSDGRFLAKCQCPSGDSQLAIRTWLLIQREAVCKRRGAYEHYPRF